MRSSDPNIAASMVILKGELSKQQLDELGREHRLYLLGAALLTAGFVLAFVRELL